METAHERIRSDCVYPEATCAEFLRIRITQPQSIIGLQRQGCRRAEAGQQGLVRQAKIHVEDLVDGFCRGQQPASHDNIDHKYISSRSFVYLKFIVHQCTVMYLRSLFDIDLDHGTQPSRITFDLLTRATVLPSVIVPLDVTLCMCS